MVAIVLVCHSGELELKAAFLIYSLRKYLRGNYTIYVGIPLTNRFISTPSPMFFSFCKTHKVETYNFDNPYLSNIKTLQEGDLISNKIFACRPGFGEEYIVFLDTDTVILRDFDIEALVRGTSTIKLKPANRANIRQWVKIYNEAGLKMPVQRVVSDIDRVEMPPYFNSGVIVMNNQIIKKLIEHWQKYFFWLSEEKTQIQIKYPFFHRDQIALALAIMASKLEYVLLGEDYNFPVRGKKIRNGALPYIVHYHNPYSIYFEKKLKKEFREFICQDPELMNTATSVWRDLFKGSYLREKSTAWLEYIRFNKYRLSNRIGKLFVF